MHNVLVTGGSRGIGLAIARRLAASGDYNVVAVARRESEDLGRAIRETGADRLHFRAFDLGQTDKIPAFVKELRDAFGAIYGLVNNAGIGTEGLLATMRNSEIEALIRLNVLSPIVLTNDDAGDQEARLGDGDLGGARPVPHRRPNAPGGDEPHRHALRRGGRRRRPGLP